MRATIAVKIYLGFIILIVLNLVQGMAGLYTWHEADQDSDRVRDIRVPTSLASNHLLKSIESSMSALQGWMLVDNPEFKTQRAVAWRKIHEELDTASRLLLEGGSTASQAKLATIKGSLNEFSQVQDAIESLAHTIGNTPALQLYFSEMAPEAAKVHNAITELIYREGRRAMGSSDPAEVKQSKQLLKAMADFGSSFAMSISHIHSYLMSGDPKYHKEFKENWQKNSGALANLSKSDGEGMLEEKQALAFKQLTQSRQLIEALSVTIFGFKPGDNFWNIGLWKMRQELLPLADKVITGISEVAQEQEQGMVAETTAMGETIDQGTLVTRIALILLTVIGLIAAAIITRLLTKPLQRIDLAIQKIAAGDLTQRVRLTSAHGDEIHTIADRIDRMTDNLARTIRTLVLQSNSVDACVQQLQLVREMLHLDSEKSHHITQDLASENAKLGQGLAQVKDSVAQASNALDIIATEGRSLTADISTIAAAAEEASMNVTTMAAAAEEMTANVAEVKRNLELVNAKVNDSALTIGEINNSFGGIRRQCESANQASEQANEHAQQSHAVMTRLTVSAREINQVVAVINNIAEQTNMLALNAAIEAAGAGDAGKGFAVVANEVKELARQTAEATRMISGKIEDIQTNTDQAATAMQEVVAVIRRIDLAMDEITQSVAEQSHNTQGIATSMQEVARAADSVTQNTRDLEVAAQDVARVASEAAQGTTEIANSAAKVVVASDHMARQANQAKEFVTSIHGFAQRTEQGTGSDKMLEAFQLATFVRSAVVQFGLLTSVVADTSAALRLTQEGLEVGEEAFDVQDAKRSMLAWLGKLREMVAGRLPADRTKMVDPHQCRFGQWIDAQGNQRFHNQTLFQEIAKQHEAIHFKGNATIDLVAQGKMDAACHHMEEYNSLRQELFAKLDLLYVEEGAELAGVTSLAN